MARVQPSEITASHRPALERRSHNLVEPAAIRTCARDRRTQAASDLKVAYRKPAHGKLESSASRPNHFNRGPEHDCLMKPGFTPILRQT